MRSLQDIVNEIREDAGRDPIDALSPEMRLREDLGFDSIELAVLTANVEAEFGVDVFADGIVRTVGEVEEKLKARS